MNISKSTEPQPEIGAPFASQGKLLNENIQPSQIQSPIEKEQKISNSNFVPTEIIQSEDSKIKNIEVNANEISQKPLPTFFPSTNQNANTVQSAEPVLCRHKSVFNTNTDMNIDPIGLNIRHRVRRSEFPRTNASLVDGNTSDLQPQTLPTVLPHIAMVQHNKNGVVVREEGSDTKTNNGKIGEQNSISMDKSATSINQVLTKTTDIVANNKNTNEDEGMDLLELKRDEIRRQRDIFRTDRETKRKLRLEAKSKKLKEREIKKREREEVRQKTMTERHALQKQASLIGISPESFSVLVIASVFYYTLLASYISPQFSHYSLSISCVAYH